MYHLHNFNHFPVTKFLVHHSHRMTVVIWGGLATQAEQNSNPLSAVDDWIIHMRYSQSTHGCKGLENFSCGARCVPRCKLKAELKLQYIPH